MLNLGSLITLERPRLRGTEPDEREEAALSTADLAPCTCPDFCERDHDTD
jgi:hypothetical protein